MSTIFKCIKSVAIIGILTSCAGGDNGNYPEGLPRALRTEPKDGPLPEYFDECDSSRITINFLGEAPAEEQLNINVISAAEFSEMPPIVLDGSGKVEFGMPVLGTSVLSMGMNDFERRIGSVWIKPGENVNIYVDNRPDSVRMDGRKVYADGYYSNMTAMMAKHKIDHVFNPFTAMEIGGYNITGDEYVAQLAVAYRDSLAVIEADTVPQMVKEYERAALKAALPGMMMIDFIIRGSYMMSHPDNPKVDPESVKLTINDDNIKTLYGIADLNDKAMLLTEVMPLSMSLPNKSIDWTAGGTQKNMLTDIARMQAIGTKASAGRLTDSDLAELGAMADGDFYTAVARSLANSYQVKYNEAVKMIHELPADIDPEKIIETIAAPYKGKVVMIDLWNTWCSPCRAAIAENEPLKSTTLSDPDIVWIYIADESSPLPLYVSQIPAIKGEHYRLTEDQATAVHKQFDLDGIPYYILVDREGNIEGRPDLRDHDLYQKTIKEKLQK